MANYVFKFVGSSKAVSPYFGKMKPGKDFKIVTEKNKLRIGENNFLPEKRLLFLGISPEWEPISKSAKDIQILVDPDHLMCDLEIGSREHFVMLHPASVNDWDRMHPAKKEKKKSE